MKLTRDAETLKLLINLVKDNPGITTKEIVGHEIWERPETINLPKDRRFKLTTLLDQHTFDTGVFENLNKSKTIIFTKNKINNENHWFMHNELTDYNGGKVNSELYDYLNNDLNKNSKSEYKKIIIEERDITKLIEDQSIIIRKRDGRFVRLVKEMYYKEKGPICQDCNLNLKEKFGLKDNYIEVHHINEFSESPLLKKEYENLGDVMDDFEFLCPNCHKSRHLKKLN